MLIVIKPCKIHKINPVWKAYVYKMKEGNAIGGAHFCPKCEVPKDHKLFKNFTDAIEYVKKDEKGVD